MQTVVIMAGQLRNSDCLLPGARTMAATTEDLVLLAVATMTAAETAGVRTDRTVATATAARSRLRLATAAAFRPRATALATLVQSQEVSLSAKPAAPCATTSRRLPCSSAATWTACWR